MLRAKYHACRDDAERAQFLEPFAGNLDDWLFQARTAQLPPPDLDRIWLLMGGRGSGKSHALSGAAHIAVAAGLTEMGAVCPTKGAFYDIFVAGPSGLCRPRGTAPLPEYVEHKRRLIWPNGATLVYFSAEEPDSLRGGNFELCLIDELAAQRRQEDVFENARLARQGRQAAHADQHHAKADIVHEKTGQDDGRVDHTLFDVRQCEALEPVIS